MVLAWGTPKLWLSSSAETYRPRALCIQGSVPGREARPDHSRRLDDGGSIRAADCDRTGDHVPADPHVGAAAEPFGRLVAGKGEGDRAATGLELVFENAGALGNAARVEVVPVGDEQRALEGLRIGGRHDPRRQDEGNEQHGGERGKTAAQGRPE